MIIWTNTLKVVTIGFNALVLHHLCSMMPKTKTWTSLQGESECELVYIPFVNDLAGL